jgi:type IV secretory pathway TraG/TraD family ATPase VirD4
LQQGQTILLFTALFAAGMAGEYYLLVFVDPLVVLASKDKLLAIFLKIAIKIGQPLRIGFWSCYILWLMAGAATDIEKRRRKLNIWGSLFFIAVFITASYALCVIHTSIPALALFTYPLSVSGVIFSGALLAPLFILQKKDSFGVRNDKRKILTPYSFNFRTRDGWINVVNPFRGVFISGGAGSGKSYSLANPIIHQAIGKGYCGLVYDFKFPVLTEEVNKALVLAGRRDIKHYIVNFYDPTRSHRLNPLKPENMPLVSYAEEYALAIINNLLLESIRKKDFWIRSANAILTAVIWFLKKHHPEHCTIPHVINTILYKDYLHVMSMLETDEQCSDMIRSALTAIENEAENQVAGVIGTLQISITKINSPEICWVLSGDDFDLDLNNSSDTKLLTLGSHPTLVDTFSPVISCIATVALKLMNQPGKRHSFVLLDEAPTIYIPKLDMIPATARSNKVATIYMAQDFSQMIASYGKEVADVVIANLNNQFYGRVGSASTAKHVSELFGKEEKKVQSSSRGRNMHDKGQSNNESVSSSLQERWLVRPQDVCSLQVGEFIGMTVESKEPYFWSKIKLAMQKEGDYTIPPFATGIDVERNFSKIKEEVESIISSYEKRKMTFKQNKKII